MKEVYVKNCEKQFWVELKVKIIVSDLRLLFQGRYVLLKTRKRKS